MKPKKNPKAQLENRRPIFFLTGLSFAIVLTIVAFQWKTELLSLKDNFASEITQFELEDIPRTVRPAPKKPKPVITNNEKLAIVDDILKTDPILEIPDLDDLTGETEEGVEIIGQEDGWDDEDVETIDFVFVEQIAVPSSCREAGTREEQVKCLNQWMANYISKEVRYPEIARINGLTGKVWITFTVGVTGEIISADLIRGEYDILNKEALRAISSMPKWDPASQRKKEVRMTMTIPINFSF